MNINNRIFIAKIFIVVMFSIIIVRLAYIQLFKGNYYLKRAVAIELKRVVIEPERGKIIDNVNNMILASSDRTYSIFTYREWVKCNSFMAKQLSKTGLISYEIAISRLKKPGFKWLIRGVGKNRSKKIVKNINRYGIKSDSIGYYVDRVREYPFKDEFETIIGRLGDDNDGLSGIEYYYNRYLKGKKGWVLFQMHPNGNVYMKGNYPRKKARNGDDIILTIDKNLQDLVYDEIKQTVNRYKALGGCAIVMDPNNGDILAMVNYSSNISNEKSSYYKSNSAISFNYEPGSIFKIVTLFAALKEKVAHLGDTLVDSTGRIVIDKIMIKDAEEHQILTVNQAFYHSSNVGMVKLAQMVGKQKYYSYIKLFGFGSKTGIDLPGEERGIVRSPDKWKNIDFSTISFGQGIAVTPIQMVVAYSAIANGGKVFKPHIVKEIRAGNKIKYSRKTEIIRNIPDKKTLNILKNMLLTVVDSGTGKKARIPGLNVAGKTGTAQQSEPGIGYTNEIVSSFVGFFPVEKPKFVIAIIIDRPEKARFASIVAAPCFSSIGSKISSMYPYSSEVYAKR
jgi:cell division protein FtsI/penicillin-binding protein 2